MEVAVEGNMKGITRSDKQGLVYRNFEKLERKVMTSKRGQTSGD